MQPFVIPILFTVVACATLQPLDNTAYNYQISHHPISIILFTASGCHSCDEAASLLEGVQADLPMGIINCSEEPRICDEAKVFSVPNIMLSVGEGELVQYRDGLSKASIEDFVGRQTGPDIMSITNVDGERFVNPTSISIVASIATNDATSRAVFAALADKWHRHYSFFLLEKRDMESSLDIKQPGLMLFKPFDEMQTVFQGHFQLSDLEAFLQSETVPLIQEMDPILYDRHVEAGFPLAHIWGSATESSQLAAMLYPLANRLRSEISFISVDRAQYPARGQQLRLGEDSVRGFAIEDVKTTRMYPMHDSELSAAGIELFVDQFLRNEVKPVVLSEAPYDNGDAALVSLTGNDFESFVLDHTRDVLVIFDVSWCDYCTELHGQLEKLGKQYEKLGAGDKVALARIDVSSNDVPVRITEYPTLKLWRAGGNEVRSFNGTFHSLLTVEELAEFVKKEGANGVDIGAQRGDSKDEL